MLDRVMDVVRGRSTRSANTMLLVTSIALYSTLVVLPGAYGSALAGPPLSGTGRGLLMLAAVAAVVLVLYRPVRPASRIGPAALAVFIAIKLAAAFVGVPTRGWVGSYELLGSVPPALAQFSSNFTIRDYRLDEKIDFRGSDFGLYFLNDSVRYGNLYSAKSRDVELPLKVAWDGFVSLEQTETLVIGASAKGNLAVTIGDETLSWTDPTNAVTRSSSALAPGDQRIQIAYDKPADQEPLVVVTIARASDGRPLDVAPSPSTEPRLATEWLWAALTTIAVLSGFAVLVLLLAQSFVVRPFHINVRSGAEQLTSLAVVVAFAGLCIVTVWNALPFAHATVALTAGDDWLVYESNARNIMQQGLLMPNGSQPGTGSPYYFYPFYPYVLAAAHWLIGDDYGAVVMLNGLAVASVVVLAWVLGWHALPRSAGVLGVGALALFAVRLLVPYSLTALTDSLFIALAFVALILATRAMVLRTPALWFLTGAVSALAAATRPSFMTFLPLLILAGAIGLRGLPLVGRARLLLMALTGFVAGVAPFAVRNYIMSGELVMLVNSWIQIPYFLYPADVANPVGFASGRPPTLTESLAEAASIIRADPLGVLVLELKKLGFTFGLTQIAPGLRPHPELVALTILGAAAFWLRRLPPVTSYVLAIFALSHICAMILATPWSYGYKNILPLHAIFLFAAAYLLSSPRGLARRAVDQLHRLRVPRVRVAQSTRDLPSKAQ